MFSKSCFALVCLLSLASVASAAGPFRNAQLRQAARQDRRAIVVSEKFQAPVVVRGHFVAPSAQFISPQHFVAPQRFIVIP